MGRAGASSSVVPKSSGAAAHSTSDPFAQLGSPSQAELPPPGEATKFFIAQAGVHKRNPPWKIALFVLSFIGGPIALIYILNTFEIVRLPMVTRTTEDGQEVQESFFSAGGISGIKEMMTGEAAKKRREAQAQPLKRPGTGGEMARKTPETPTKPISEKAAAVEAAKRAENEILKGMWDENETGTRGPRVTAATSNTPAESKDGLGREVIDKVLLDHRKAFNICIENAKRRNPNLSVKGATVTLSIGTSGSVKASSIEPKQHETAEWGQCILRAGKRIVFPPSAGETDVEIPLKLSDAIQL
jgi:hypothetical protein